MAQITTLDTACNNFRIAMIKSRKSEKIADAWKSMGKKTYRGKK
jgi:hypothetical protein